MRLHPVENPEAIQLSQSSLESYFQCPARLKLSSEWKRRDEYMAIALRDGIDAHALLAGEAVPDASPSAVGYYESLLDLQIANGIEVHTHERIQTIQLWEGVYYKRIIDGIGTWQGIPVVIDYKSSSKGPWMYFKSGRRKIIPKAHSFQAVSYLLPPHEEELDALGMDVWPDTFLFLVSDAMGHGEVVTYQRDPAMEENFYSACRQVADAIRAERFPNYYGGSCGILGTSWACSFLEMCYQVDGWENIYEPAYSDMEEQ